MVKKQKNPYLKNGFKSHNCAQKYPLKLYWYAVLLSFFNVKENLSKNKGAFFKLLYFNLYYPNYFS